MIVYNNINLDDFIKSAMGKEYFKSTQDGSTKHNPGKIKRTQGRITNAEGVPIAGGFYAARASHELETHDECGEQYIPYFTKDGKPLPVHIKFTIGNGFYNDITKQEDKIRPDLPEDELLYIGVIASKHLCGGHTVDGLVVPKNVRNMSDMIERQEGLYDYNKRVKDIQNNTNQDELKEDKE